jgi:hypothetical protein
LQVIRRIGEDEVRAASRQLFQLGNAIAGQDLV